MIKTIKILGVSILSILVMAAIYIHHVLNGSEPILEGTLQLDTLQSNVDIQRDIQGIPTIRSDSRADSAYGLGFLHAQERFFQMDLLRKNSAGELSELFSALASKFDRNIRKHQFRKRALNAYENMTMQHKVILDAYTQGVNAGLNTLSSKPFEYHLLNVTPKNWHQADTLLVLYSMYMDLQPEWSQSERSLAAMKDLLPRDWFAFLTSQGGYWDAPINGDALPEVKQLPKQALAELITNLSEIIASRNGVKNNNLVMQDYQFFDQIHYGSNNWSVSGKLTEHGSAMVADDMHLGLRVPNIWYRASWYLNDGRRVTGATLPGTPALVAGSNEYVAWGFTNSQGDYHDVIELKVNDSATQYLTDTGWKNFKIEKEIINIKGQDSEEVDIKLTQWGPVIGENHNGQLIAMRWVAHDVQGGNLNLLELENANHVDDALKVAPLAGIPGQNLNVVDKFGNQAWTIIGRLPKRFGFDMNFDELNMLQSQLPQDWSKGDKGWNGYLTPGEYPVVKNPKDGRLWTANARIVGGDLLKKVGIHNYALGARQKQIKDDLYEKQTFNAQDFLDIQLDDEALFLNRWQQYMLALTEADNASYQEVRSVLTHWQGRASKTSAGYLLVKRFREKIVDQTIGRLYEKLDKGLNFFSPSSIDNFVEYPVWQLINEKPKQHVPAGYNNWDEFLLAMLHKTVNQLTENGGSLADQTWGKANTLAIRHPLSKAIPMLGYFLDMPAEPVDGDTYMPRVQDPDTGASERFAVAPGHEEEGFFHMATGQSGHPLSPYYDAGHRDWVEGKLSRFLPAETKWQLTLSPSIK